jgi:hypothetical protein
MITEPRVEEAEVFRGFGVGKLRKSRLIKTMPMKDLIYKKIIPVFQRLWYIIGFEDITIVF